MEQKRFTAGPHELQGNPCSLGLVAPSYFCYDEQRDKDYTQSCVCCEIFTAITFTFSLQTLETDNCFQNYQSEGCAGAQVKSSCGIKTTADLLCLCKEKGRQRWIWGGGRGLVISLEFVNISKSFWRSAAWCKFALWSYKGMSELCHGCVC